MGIEIEHPIGYASSGILYFVTPAQSTGINLKPS